MGKGFADHPYAPRPCPGFSDLDKLPEPSAVLKGQSKEGGVCGGGGGGAGPWGRTRHRQRLCWSRGVYSILAPALGAGPAQSRVTETVPSGGPASPPRTKGLSLQATEATWKYLPSDPTRGIAPASLLWGRGFSGPERQCRSMRAGRHGGLVVSTQLSRPVRPLLKDRASCLPSPTSLSQHGPCSVTCAGGSCPRINYKQ